MNKILAVATLILSLLLFGAWQNDYEKSQESPNGARAQFGVNEENITLSTSGLTTDSAANLLPANSIIDNVIICPENRAFLRLTDSRK